MLTEAFGRLDDGQDVLVNDVTLRDGSHPMKHRFRCSQVGAIAAALDRCGVDLIEVGHGWGLGGSSIEFGLAADSDEARLIAAAQVIGTAKLMVLATPGIATPDDLRMARGCGVQAVRIAVVSTEATLGVDYLQLVRDLGMSAVTSFMMAHLIPPSALAERAAAMEAAGAELVYIVDSTGTMLPEQVVERVDALKQLLSSARIGFHAHDNLGLAIANALAAIRAGTTVVDASLCSLGAGAGNCQMEILAAVLARCEVRSRLDVVGLCDAAANLVRPLGPSVRGVEKRQLLVGYSGRSASLVAAAAAAAGQIGVDLKDLLDEMSRRQMVDGQEAGAAIVAAELAKGAGPAFEERGERDHQGAASTLPGVPSPEPG